MIQIENLKYSYDTKPIFALKKRKRSQKYGVDIPRFEMKQGERMAIIGFNGAGKSTFLKLLIGILRPTEGIILINGIQPWQNRKKHVKNLGIVWGHRTTLWWDLSVRESLAAIQKIYEVPKERFQERLKVYSDVFQCKDFIDRPLRQLSLGQRVKAEIIAALLHSPEILILDEPFIGLDFISKRAIIKELNLILDSTQTTLFLTSHDIDDIDLLCDSITILNKGEILASCPKDELLQFDRKVSEIEIQKDSKDELKISPKILEEQIISIEYNEEYSLCRIKVKKGEESSKDIIKDIVEQNEGIQNISILKSGLENAIEERIRENMERLYE